MRIAMIASESVPFAKTGGLADVVGALPKALQRLGHEVIVILPLYGSIDYRGHGLERWMAPLGVWMGNTLEWCAVHKAVGDGGIATGFIQHDRCFDRDGLYHDAAFNDYPDNPRRFALFSRAALQLLIDMPWMPDVIHAHDWQAAPAMAYLKLWHWNEPRLAGSAGLLTIHNIAYQGIYGAEHLDYTGLGRENFQPEIFEDHGRINYLKGGIYFADRVNTVSPTYARETRSGPLSCGMAPFLNRKGDRYSGILNGVDYAHWSPENDRYLPEGYTAQRMDGKRTAKRWLQRAFHLTADETIPIIGIVSRFAAQKGLDVVAQVVESILREMVVQFVVLGSGDNALEQFFRTLPDRCPSQAGVHIGFSDELSHRIEGGSDFFLMPSLYEPCGLNQIYSLRYGTLPIVRATGGLDDTVEQYDEATGSGTGFKFNDLTPAAVYYTVGWAVSTWYDRPAHIAAMRRAAMAQDFSWESSARRYEELYERATTDRRGPATPDRREKAQ